MSEANELGECYWYYPQYPILLTFKAESLQSELSEANKTIFLLKQKLDEYDLANRRSGESLTSKTNQMKDQSEAEKLVNQL